ncbi:MAG TPA: hypothetical protein VGM54_15140 [Chthoniobacter sp.]|jgi:hypothetical protein
MKDLRSGSLVRAVIAALVALILPVRAADPADHSRKQIPEALKGWENWAIWDDKDRDCPTPYSSPKNHLCFWPSRMGLRVEKTGAQFDMVVTTFAEAWVPLVGGDEAWPLEVKANDAPVVVLEHDGHPSVRLAAGTFHLTGSYQWAGVPQRIPIPHEIGILGMVVDGQPVETPVWDAEGYLWLKHEATTEQTGEDFLSTKVYAELEDGIPLWLHLQVELTVSGKSREEEIGNILPEGWKLASVENPIPAIIDDAGKMKAQVRPGRWVITVNAFRFDNPKEIRFAQGIKPAVAEEFVALDARPEMRVLEIAGAAVVDVSQTTVPAEWRQMPVYRWNTSTPFRLEERMRGMGQRKPAGLQILREWWLDENGKNFTFRDFITASSQQIWRLDSAAGQELGAVRSEGLGQLITRNPQNGATGVEIRSQSLNLEATGRMARLGGLSATGWRSDADKVEVTLNLPPGWRLLSLSGADWVRGDWLTSWTLLDLFLLLVFSLAVLRLWGIGAAALAFVAFGLSYHEIGAPRFLWLILLVPLALLRVVPGGWGRRVVSIGKWVALVALLFALVPFLAGQVQQAIYPQLERFGEERGFFGRHGIREGGAAPIEEPGFAPVPSSNFTTTKIRNKLERLVIPELTLREATVREAIDFIHKKSVELDVGSPPNDRGVRMLLKLEPSAPPGVPGIPGIPGLESSNRNPPIPGSTMNPSDVRITVSLTNIPVIEALKYVTGLANLKFKIEPDAVSIVPLSEPTDVLVTKEWKISPDLIPRTPGAGALSAPAFGGAADTTRGGVGLVDRESAKNWLIANGVQFNGGASAIYIVKSSRLIVRGTQDQLDLIDQLVSAGGAAAAPGASPAAPAFRGVSSGDNLAYDANARIQTGPAVPEWKWRTVSFGWNGPVSASQQVRPVLISFGLERLLTIVRVAAMIALIAVLLGVWKLGGPVLRVSGKAAAILLCFLALSANVSAQNPIPDQLTLDKLRERLLETSDAYPLAADIPTVSLSLKDQKVVIDAEVHTAIRTAVPMPGKLPAWSPVTVLVDDKPEVTLRRDSGYLWVLIDAGIHHVHMEGSLSNVTEWEWNWILKPHLVKIEAAEWTVSGLKPGGIPDTQVLFTRKEKVAAEQNSYGQQNLAAMVAVNRTLEFGLVWEVHTTVNRLSFPRKATVLRIPLLPGENVLTPGAVIKEGMIEVRLGANDQSFQWDSELPVTKQLELATRADDTWIERWRLIASPVWDVTLAGLAPTFEPNGSDLTPGWSPWPGESVELSISRPEAMPGATATVNKVSHELTLGTRTRTTKLEFSLRSTLGEDFLVELPADADVTELLRNSRAIPVRKVGAKLVIPMSPGDQTVSVTWHRNIALGADATTDDLQLPAESANIVTTINVPEDRWLLWASGPQRGPAVRFWSILLFSLLAAAALGRVSRSPLHTMEWMLLVIGLTLVPLPAALAVVGWLFFIAWRGSEGFQRLGNAIYNTLQATLILLTLVALTVFVSVVSEGLLGRPEMFVIGNGSTPAWLQWFQTHSDGSLPRCGCISISIWWYRFLMLLWALWLASALIRWLRKGWQGFSAGGIFHWKPDFQVPPPIPAKK